MENDLDIMANAPSGAAIMRGYDGHRFSVAIPDRRPIYEWAREHIVLPETYARPGAFEASRWMMPIFDAIQSHTVREVWLMAAIQSGKTLVSDIAIPWVLVNAPGPVMLTMQSEDDMKEHMKTRLWPVFRSCPPLMRMMPADRFDRSTKEIYFGSHFFIANSANINALQSKSIQWKFNDELWLPQWQKLYIHAAGRVTAFEERGASKIVNVSQAGDKGDVMDRGYRSGTQRHWEVDGWPLIFHEKKGDDRFGLIWSDDAKRKDGTWNKARAIETCRYRSPDGTEWPDDPKTRRVWQERGKWSDPVDGAASHIESYQLNALLTRPMNLLVSQWIDASESARLGDMGPMADFVRKRRSEPWEDKQDAIELSGRPKFGYETGDVYTAEPITGESFRAITLDRQKGMRGDVPHWWLEARAWRSDGSSRQLTACRVDTREGIEEIRERLNVPARMVLQDAGYDPHQVYGDCVELGWSCCFGSERRRWEHTAHGRKFYRPHSPLRPVNHGGKAVMIFEFSTDYHKDILSNLLHGRGAAWELPDDVNPEYLEHIKAERKEQVKPGKWTWKPIHSTKANHLWDCSVMQVVLAVIRGLLASAVDADGE